MTPEPIPAAGVVQDISPSTAYCIPDVIQERIGQKIVGAATLDLTGDRHRFEMVTPDGLVRHSILDYPDVYPALAGITGRPGLAGPS